MTKITVDDDLKSRDICSKQGICIEIEALANKGILASMKKIFSI
jgi:hypothetical protein